MNDVVQLRDSGDLRFSILLKICYIQYNILRMKNAQF